MLEHIFGSRTRVKLFRLFLGSPQEDFFVREITRVIEEQINSVRRELNNLEEIGLVMSTIKDKKKYYSINPDFPLLHELQALIMKTRFVSEQEFIQAIRGLGPIQYFGLFGQFVHDESAPTDMLIVGNVSKTRLQKLVEQFTETFGKQIRYTVFSEEEYRYRKDVADKFLYDLLNRRSITMMNKLDVIAGESLDRDNPFYNAVHSPSRTRWDYAADREQNDTAAMQDESSEEVAG